MAAGSGTIKGLAVAVNAYWPPIRRLDRYGERVTS